MVHGNDDVAVDTSTLSSRLVFGGWWMVDVDTAMAENLNLNRLRGGKLMVPPSMRYAVLVSP